MPIDADSAFNSVQVTFTPPGGTSQPRHLVGASVYNYPDGLNYDTYVPGVSPLRTSVGGLWGYEWDSTPTAQVLEVVKRVRAGTCKVWLKMSTDAAFVAYDDFAPHHFGWQMKHPFHPDRHLQALWEWFHSLSFTEGAGDDPDVLRTTLRLLDHDDTAVPAEPDPTVPLDSFRIYKRDDATSVARPMAGPAETKQALLTALLTEGWHDIVPVGPRRLHFTDVERFADSVNYMSPMRLYRSLDYTAWIRTIATRYKAWEDALEPTDTGASYDTTKEWWKSWIGRAWSLKPFTADQRIFYDGNLSTKVLRDANDVPDWILGHLEEWLQKPNGIEDFRTALNQSLAQARLDDFESFHVKSDGTPGDILANPTSGLVQADWDAFTGTHYNAAAGITGD